MNGRILSMRTKALIEVSYTYAMHLFENAYTFLGFEKSVGRAGRFSLFSVYISFLSSKLSIYLPVHISASFGVPVPSLPVSNLHLYSSYDGYDYLESTYSKPLSFQAGEKVSWIRIVKSRSTHRSCCSSFFEWRSSRASIVLFHPLFSLLE